MPMTIRNRRPSILYIPDAAVRLDPDGTTTVLAVTPQIQALLARQVLEVIQSTSTPAVPPSPVPASPPKKSGRMAPKEPADDAR